MILFPPGTNIITIDDEGIFGDRKASQFLPGRKIFIRMGGSGDFLDEAAKHTNPRYNEIKNTATIWKAELQNLLTNRFGGDYAKLTKYLEGYGVVREEVTVKNWLNDMSLIAPRAHSDTLQKFAQMHVSSAMKEGIQKIIEAVYSTYEMRREASEVILRELNSQIKIDGAETTVRLRFGNELLDFSVETIEALGAQITTSIGNLGVVQDVH